MDEHIYKTISTSFRRPPKSLTDHEWQQCFSYMKDEIQPSLYSTMNQHVIASREQRRIVDTKLQNYANYIDDVLKSIRRGKIDYCYFFYQIADLLQFEHDHLQTEYIPEDECFKVWLSES